jgi:hypothetical protein
VVARGGGERGKRGCKGGQLGSCIRDYIYYFPVVKNIRQNITTCLSICSTVLNQIRQSAIPTL